MNPGRDLAMVLHSGLYFEQGSPLLGPHSLPSKDSKFIYTDCILTLRKGTCVKKKKYYSEGYFLRIFNQSVIVISHEIVI
jgi:hypothetical protein